MNGFHLAKDVEQQGLERLRPFIHEVSGGRYVRTDKGPLAPYVQQVADIMLNDANENMWGLEIKTEREHRKNVFLETWSNRNLESRESYSARGSTMGWMYTNRADILMYYFLDSDYVYIFNLWELKRWAFVGRGDNKPRIFDFPEKAQRRYSQLNDTWGRCVPTADLQRELSPPPVRVKVSQLSLNLEPSKSVMPLAQFGAV